MKTKTNLFFLLLMAITSVPLFANNSNQAEPTLIELLENGESYSIEITSIGCFNGTRQTILISKDADVFTASLQDESIVLTTEEIELFRTFEIELRALQRGGCSTVDTYVLQFGNETFQTSDGTCSWHGYRPILKLFG